jgi:hypothetical protein
VPRAPIANLLDKPLGEDAFYMFSVARSLAASRGISYGGTPTTGIQPLATFLYAFLYWLAAQVGLSPTAPLRLILIANVTLLILTGWLTGALVTFWLRQRGVRGTHGFWIAATIVVVNPAAFRLFGYGLETGLYLCAIVALQLVLNRAPDRLGILYQVMVGVLLGLCILARLDFVILGSVVFGWLVLTRRIRLRDAIGIGTSSIVVVVPWLLYVYSVMGGIMPSSGAAEAGAVTSATELAGRAWVMTSAVVGALSSVVYLPVSVPIPILALLMILLAGVRWLGPDIRTMCHENAIWIVGAAALALYYLIFSAAGHFYGRYLAPLWLLWTQLVAAGLALMLARWPERNAAFAYHLGAFALTLLFAVQMGHTVHRGHAGNSHLFSAFYIHEHAAELGTVGAFQSGVIGYVNDERTINLDGKLDGQALRMRRHLECYLAQRGITTLIDWPGYIHNGWIEPSFVRLHLREVGRVPGGASVIMAVNATGAGCP